MTKKKPAITGVNCYKDKDHGYVDKDLIKFSAWFDDGIIIVYRWLDDKLNYDYMLSVGLSSYFATVGKWPTDNNINKRQKLVEGWVLKNINRYKPIKELNKKKKS